MAANLLSKNRLHRDLNEWKRKKNEFPCIEAVPLESNIYQWHCNIAPNDGAFVGLIIHLIINFPTDYPIQAPSVYLCNSIPHPNVNGNDICLDMLVNDSSGHYSGWTSAYSVVSILMQLQVFLFEERGFVESNYPHSTKNYYFSRESLKLLHENVKQFKCKECGHCFERPYPVPPSVIAMEKECDYYGGKIERVIGDNTKQNKLAEKCFNILDVFTDNS